MSDDKLLKEIAEALDEAAVRDGQGDMVWMALYNADDRIREQRKLLDECSQVIERAITNDVIVSRKLYHAFGSLLKRLRGEPAQEKADEIKRPVEA